MSDQRRIVYGLLDPRSGSIRYVGKSSVGLKRPRRHQQPRTLAKDTTHKGNWLRQLHREGQRAEIVTLGTYDTEEALVEGERHWIAALRAQGNDLTNLTDGGEGAPGKPMSPTTRAAVLKANTGRKMPNNVRAAILAATKDRKPTAEQLARQAAAQKGRMPAEANRRATLAANKGRPRDDAERVRISRAKGGRPFVDQHGTRYETIKGAAAQLGLWAAHVNSVLKGRLRQTGGFSFTYV